ncbi:Asp23/Gls24 family envelope stress response protein [Mycolicibacterium sp. CBMA 226]|uniref:Asp23/Gls24 family envelope stress response protein n=1 Tax=Mycolicibacterium sp. CBMA 226 TaxID=2606611 RepID=UPI0013071ADD|nr:Asp23/Gls24 family envelope stress response protein [Mycolicibacterium sp. CBMA 226]MUL78446.1 Asp23/Gls24 family envelope stress response protein [Mycolicibacterium sp. CBMA 226]
MTESDTAEPVAAESDSEDDGATRGTLTVREKVAQRLAVRAALDTPDVLPFSEGRAKIPGRSLPQAQLTVTGDRVTAHLKVTVAWPASAVDVARAVQRNVARTLSDMGGLQVDRVDVTVEQFSTVTKDTKRTR